MAKGWDTLHLPKGQGFVVVFFFFKYIDIKKTPHFYKRKDYKSYNPNIVKKK